MNVTRQLFIVYILSAIFSGGRLFVGAISVLYVLSHGISIGDFAFIKSVQVVTFLLLDIPAGLLIKRIGYKNSLLLTFAFSISGLFLYVVGSGLFSFALAEFITAISLCLCPAAFADYTMNFLKKFPELLMEKVFHRNDMYTNIANVACGALGGFLYTQARIAPYLAGIFTQILGLYFIFKMARPENIIGTNNGGVKNFIKSSMKSLKFTDTRIIMPVVLLFVIQLTVQPLYHYWQPLFYEINQNISGTTLGFLFMSYSACSIVLNYVFSKLVHKEFFRSLNCILFMLFLSAVFYYITAIAQQEIIAFVSFTLLQGILFTALTCISAILNRHIDDQNRAVVIKAISFLSRIGMLLSFGYIQIFAFLEMKPDTTKMEVHALYLQSTIVLLIFVVASAILHYYFSYLKTCVRVKNENAES